MAQDDFDVYDEPSEQDGRHEHGRPDDNTTSICLQPLPTMKSYQRDEDGLDSARLLDDGGESSRSNSTVDLDLDLDLDLDDDNKHPSRPTTPAPHATWRSYVWDTWDRPPAERRLLHKVDAVVLTFASIGYFLKTLDQTNVYNAFLSGMKEELHMDGNELVTSTSLWTAGYVLGQIPATLLITRVSPRWVIPSLEVGWGLATVCAATVQSPHALYLLRFFVGLFESGFYPSIHYLLGSIYTPPELGKRTMLFWLSGSVGKLFSGFLQAAAYERLHGVHGLSGWRWLFVVDGFITLPLALLGYVFFPHLPQSGDRTWWLSEAEQQLSVDRMQAIGRAGKQPWTREKVRRIVRSWHTYLLPLLYILWNNGGYQNAMGYWLKSFNADPPPVPGVSFTIGQINSLPLVCTGILIAMSLVWGWLSDALRGSVRRWPFIYIGAVIHVGFAIAFLRMPLYENIHARKVVYWFSDIGGGAGPLILIWINEICSADTEKRALIVAMANDLAYALQALAPNFVWRTTDFPAARRGYTWSITLQVLMVLVTVAIQVLLWRDRRRDEAAAAKQSRQRSTKAGKQTTRLASWQDAERQPLVYTAIPTSEADA
ncbi:MFS transporter, ACS family, pantothenate transporter [Sporothrix brasiliensis 5110]|uniref:MFS transporter, ACS family, pantothenate transporter n=1 Tax=Sporothrix brasiliensis 5110 TaxID=1398154 RepID=A0A0C2IDG2_9PEZI|nr:MFS transporter, ACS family, pantothenate transporter [Sporothrix brasiliensis 5110]KIH87316.1 MFS transporter, ACS family, pantothenate transporter [Sporothrix brasiliensis 5110]